MAMKVEQPETLDGGGQFLSKPGIYHLLITGVDENPVSRDGAPINGLQVSMSVLAGTQPDQKDKTIDLMLWHPRPEDNSDQPKKRQTRFCLASCLLGQHTPGQKTTVEPTDAVGRQIVANFSWKQKKDEATGKWVDSDRIDLHYSDIWHVDDEAVAKNNVPLDQAALKMIPAALRKAKPTNGQPATKAVVPVTGTRAMAAAVDIGDV